MSKPKRPRDPNQLAKLMLDIATGEVQDTLSDIKKKPFPRGKAGGLKGGKARAKSLSERQRKEIAMKAAQARWKSRKAD